MNWYTTAGRRHDRIALAMPLLKDKLNRDVIYFLMPYLAKVVKPCTLPCCTWNEEPDGRDMRPVRLQGTSLAVQQPEPVCRVYEYPLAGRSGLRQ